MTLHPAGLAGLQRNLALVDKPFCQRPGEFFLWFKRKILVVRVRLTGGKHVSRVVEIIIPLSGKQRRIAVLITRMQENDVAAVFRGQVNMTVRDRLTDLLCNFLENMRLRAVFNLVDGIKTQAVQAVLGQPVERRIGNVMSYRLALVGDSVAPGVIRSASKKAGDSNGR